MINDFPSILSPNNSSINSDEQHPYEAPTDETAEELTPRTIIDAGLQPPPPPQSPSDVPSIARDEEHSTNTLSDRNIPAVEEAQRSNAADEEDPKPDDPEQPAENETVKDRASNDDMIARLTKDLEKQLKIKLELEAELRQLKLRHKLLKRSETKLQKRLVKKRRQLGIEDRADGAPGEGLSSTPACHTEASRHDAQAQQSQPQPTDREARPNGSNLTTDMLQTVPPRDTGLLGRGAPPETTNMTAHALEAKMLAQSIRSLFGRNQRGPPHVVSYQESSTAWMGSRDQGRSVRLIIDGLVREPIDVPERATPDVSEPDVSDWENHQPIQVAILPHHQQWHTELPRIIAVRLAEVVRQYEQSRVLTFSAQRVVGMEFVALFGFRSRRPDRLNFNAGDIMQIVGRPHDLRWGMVDRRDERATRAGALGSPR